MPPEDRQRVARIREAFEGKETKKLYARGVKHHAPWNTSRRLARLDLDKVFPDHQIKVEDVIDSGDKVVVRWRLRGKHGGDFGRIRATGDRVDFTGINIYRFEGDKVVEAWGEFDSASLASQCRVGPEIFEFVARPVGQPG